jgi:hypothetical protein
MSDLLSFAVSAHGGLERWNTFQAIEARMAVGGGIFTAKRNPGLQNDVTYRIQTREERVAIDRFSASDRRVNFVPSRLTLETLGGELIEARDNPRSAFAGQTEESPWDTLHVAYFISYALWTYLNLPFLYTWPDFVTEEVGSWHENGEEWRRLKATFPQTVASHSAEQVTYFGPDGLMRRHDYTVDVLGGATGANYTTNYKDIQGIQIPTTRRVYAYDENGQMIPDPLLVSIDIASITLRK